MKKNNKGFTLAELLIVVAIIGVLIAIAMPAFSASLTKAQIATDKSNCRAKYAELQSDYLTNMDNTSWTKKEQTTATNKITFEDSSSVTLKKGKIKYSFVTGKGYKVEYVLDNASDGTGETWGAS